MSRLFDLTTTPIDDGITVIEASAGTGKTYCLTGLVLRLLLERRVSEISELLVVTFTRAATQELVERLRAGLTQTCRLLAGEDDSADPFFLHLAETYRGDRDALRLAREALVRFDDLTVSTIHGFCLRILEESAFESGEPFEGELVENAAPLLLESARDVWRQLLYHAPGIATVVVTEAGLTPESFLSDFALSQKHPYVKILPPPLDLEEAMERLEKAHGALGNSWDTVALRRLLEPRRFLRGAYFSGGVLQDRLRDAEAFSMSGEPSGLRPILELAGDRLEPSLFKRDRAGVAKHPVIAACTAFGATVEAFRHALRCRFVGDVGQRFEADKRSARVWSYDDLLRRLRRALDHPRHGRALAHSVRQKYRAALIDEFQDTDLIQYEIFHRLFRHGPMVLIGDPKQAIYRFRGADVFAYLAARDGADRIYTLAHNWRTEPPLVEAVNAVFSRSSASTRPFVFEQIAFEPAVAARPDHPTGDGSPPLQWIWVPRMRTREQTRAAIERAITAEVGRLLASSKAPPAPGDIAVLVRTNDQAASLQSVLRTAGIPSVIGRSGDIFHSEEMADLEALLVAIADPGDGGSLRAAWATRLWGASDRDLREADRDDETAARHRERFGFFRRDWRRRGFMPMIQQLFAERGVRRRRLASVAGERRLTNLLHATEVLHRAERERHLSPAALLDWLAAERARDRPETDDTELRLESDAAAVQIATVHRSKGLEYDIVFCPYLWQARTAETEPVQAHLASTPRREAQGSRLVLDYGSDALAEHRAQAEAERLSEEARLTYVALTRARRRCYVVWGDVSGRHGPADSALGYLLHRGGVAAGGSSAGQIQQALAAVAAGREGWQRELNGLVAAHEDVMELRSLEDSLRDPQTAALPASLSPASEHLESRRFRGSIPRPWSLESFSSLSRLADDTEPASTGHPPETSDVRDPALPAARPAETGHQGIDHAPEAQPSGISAFARGLRAGSCLHFVLERWDPERVDHPETRELTAEALRRFGLEDPRRHGPSAPGFDPAEAVHDLLRRLANAPLPDAGVTFAAVPRTAWLVEWKFTMPLGRISPRRLARVFRHHGEGVVGSDYATRLEYLGSSEVHGYLTGFVDLVFEHDGRWYLLDWKSNDLGPTLSAYDQEGLWQAMAHHHYVLQYHLYLVALHRFLRQRLPDYDYERHLSGAIYVFLRGLAETPATEATGWYVDRPPRALIEALDRLIGGRE